MISRTIVAAGLDSGMTIETDNDRVVLDEVWPDQGPGLGIMAIGRTVDTDKPWEKRFYDTEEAVEQLILDEDQL